MPPNNKQLIRQLKASGYSIEIGPTKLAFLVRNLGTSQLAYEIITEINNYEDICIDPIVYIQTAAGSSISTHEVPIFYSREIRSYTGNLVATCLSTANELSKAVRANNIYYVYNTREIVDNIDDQNVIDILEDSSILKVFRTKMPQNVLNKTVAYSQVIVPLIDIGTFMETI